MIYPRQLGALIIINLISIINGRGLLKDSSEVTIPFERIEFDDEWRSGLIAFVLLLEFYIYKLENQKDPNSILSDMSRILQFHSAWFGHFSFSY